MNLKRRMQTNLDMLFDDKSDPAGSLFICKFAWHSHAGARRLPISRGQRQNVKVALGVYRAVKSKKRQCGVCPYRAVKGKTGKLYLARVGARIKRGSQSFQKLFVLEYKQKYPFRYTVLFKCYQRASASAHHNFHALAQKALSQRFDVGV